MTVYHGSMVNVDVLKPTRTKRTRFTNGKLVIGYEGISLHATSHKWIAISYIRKKIVPFIHKGKTMYFRCGVRLFNELNKPCNPKIITISGKRNLEYSLSKIFTNGYLYSFPSTNFEGNETIKGLGDLEVVSFNKEIPKKKIFILNPVKTLRSMGVEFKFIDLTKYDNVKK
jgi:hypothetical protein